MTWKDNPPFLVTSVLGLLISAMGVVLGNTPAVLFGGIMVWTSENIRIKLEETEVKK